MIKKTIDEINEEYDLELNKIVNNIKRQKALVVLLQFSDGLKPYATTIAEEIENKLKGKSMCLIWLGSCFGACDVPIEVEKIKPKIDLIVQFGHNEILPKF